MDKANIHQATCPQVFSGKEKNTTNNVKEHKIDYKELERILDKMMVHAQTAKSECHKENPDLVTLCDNSIEEMWNLVSDAERCICTLH